MPLYYSGTTITGSGDADIILAQGANNTVYGGSGADIMLGDIGSFRSVYGTNNSFANAFNLDSSTAWSTDENDLFGNDSLAHTTLSIIPQANQQEYFEITLAAGETITLDIDGAGGSLGSNDDSDISLRIFNSAETQIASNFTSPISNGGLGSVDTSDPYLSFTAPSAGTYYILVNNNGLDFQGDEHFLLNITSTHHATSGADVAGDDVMYGGSGNDLMMGGGGDDTMFGGQGTDTMYGGTGHDTMAGGPFTGDLYGGNGNDIFENYGGAFIDNVYGGSGSDTLDLRNRTTGNADIDLSAGTYTASSQTADISSVETIFATHNDDTIDLGGLSGYTANGAGGNDTIIGGLNYQLLRGNDGNDTIDGGFASGSAVGDSLYGGNGDDTITGANGDDYAHGGDDSDRITLNGGDDVALGGLHIDTIYGGDGDDTMSGGQHRDYLYGGDDDDRLNGNGGDDYMIGGNDNDRLDGNNGNDSMYGGSDNDRLYGGSGNDIVNGGVGNDVMNGGNDNDTMYGSNGNDRFYGSSGSDFMYGGADNDRMFGGSGDDYMDGDTGNDVMRGSSGSDTFNFEIGDGDDRIIDFEINVDTIDLASTGLGYNNLNFVAVGNSTRVEYSATDSIMLQGVNVNDLDQNDFLF
ncbi:hypothetical protein GCM10008927_00830 [Amylibacter ulvae]|uniref:Peptidase C-terminal archaeal/bacterial domain-containing protein n=1 Tax=Paramylibacter ulvae TaxID=1651968 RepID=A0ABQ3CV70_9RHOB|nr:pre-peptidase C-terminal domain-containing protein [Amylibacter ulvae]GHA40496.1 hypothetical protein GCM10008927_00830 [Amylibacter ulvae]